MKRDRILVFGDVIVDEEIQVERGSFSAEGLATYLEHSRKWTAGGAANVAKHLARLGAQVCLVHQGQPIPISSDELDDSESRRISQVGQGGGGHPTKTRFYSGNEKIFKVNRPGVPAPTPAKTRDLLEQLTARGGFQLVLACDNGDSFFRADNRHELVDACRKKGIPLWVDAQLSQTIPTYLDWIGSTSIFLNEDEAYEVGGIIGKFPEYHLKLGPDGSRLFQQGRFEGHDGFSVPVVDTVGAGDAYLAAFAVYGDVRIANAWAALSCTKRGTSLPQLSDMEKLDASFAGFGQPG